jgi:ribosome-binding protein aMBF1 (putative translation factor)
MPVCKECKDEVDELMKVRLHGKTVRACEDCADRLREEAEVAEASEGVIQDMMGYKGRR